MKDIFDILEKAGKGKLQKVISFNSTTYPAGEWQALNLIESTARLMLRRIHSALPRGYALKVTQLDCDLFNKPGNGEKLFIKAQLYPPGKHQSLLKIFAHESDRKGKATKLARAVYYIDIAADKPLNITEVQNSRRGWKSNV